MAGWSTSSSHPWPRLEPQRAHTQECVQVRVCLRDQPRMGFLSSRVTLSWPWAFSSLPPHDLVPALPPTLLCPRRTRTLGQASVSRVCPAHSP